MTWQSTPPTEAGWYWYKQMKTALVSKPKPEAILVWIYQDELFAKWKTISMPVGHLVGDWSERISEPE